MLIYEFDNFENADSWPCLWQEPWWEWMVSAYRDLRHSLGVVARQAVHRHLARAEQSGQMTEFQAVIAQFIIAMYDTPQFALRYLEMVEAAASSECERAAASAARVVHDRLQSNDRGQARRRAPVLSSDSAVELWYRFLGGLGETASHVRSELRGPCAA